jgi:hypothetical protein
MRDTSDFYNATLTWNTLTQPVGVVPDSQAFAQNLTSAQVQSRNTTVTARGSQVSDAITKITATLATIDRLYDYRYTWIDTRINLETGIIVKKQRAIVNRIKAQQDILNSMLKLLAVQ